MAEEQAGQVTPVPPATPEKPGWTPPVIIQAFKEVVTALIGLGIVGYMLYLASRTLYYVGAAELAAAKDILLLVLGLAGVVLGYYFGRVPADARATQSQEQADTATAQAEQVSAAAEEVANRVEEVLDGASSAERGGGEADVTADLQRIRDRLRGMARMRYR